MSCNCPEEDVSNSGPLYEHLGSAANEKELFRLVKKNLRTKIERKSIEFIQVFYKKRDDVHDGHCMSLFGEEAIKRGLIKFKRDYTVLYKKHFGHAVDCKLQCQVLAGSIVTYSNIAVCLENFLILKILCEHLNNLFLS